jgi:hypothetical protein
MTQPESHATTQPESSKGSGRRTFEDQSQHRSWNFLYGEGPSSSSEYYSEPKASRWQSKRHEASIQQAAPRLEAQTIKVCMHMVVLLHPCVQAGRQARLAQAQLLA